MSELLLVLLGGIAVLLFTLKCRETFVLKYGNPFAGEDFLSFDRDAKGTRLFSTTPDTCPLDRPVLDAGLCYEECEEGYHGVGPVCWADTKDNGPGILADFRSCNGSYEEGGMGIEGPPKNRAYTDLGFTCFWPGNFKPGCKSSKRDAFGNCFAWDLDWDAIELPDLVVKGLKCPGNANVGAKFFNLLGDLLGTDSLKTDIGAFTDLIDGMCYRKCPDDKPNHVPGMPYLCTKGERGLSYGRGAGTVPPLFHFGA